MTAARTVCPGVVPLAGPCIEGGAVRHPSALLDKAVLAEQPARKFRSPFRRERIEALASLEVADLVRVVARAVLDEFAPLADARCLNAIRPFPKP